jgi:hypothetical protein
MYSISIKAEYASRMRHCHTTNSRKPTKTKTTKTCDTTHLSNLQKKNQRPHAFHRKIASGSSRCACKRPCSHSHSILSRNSCVSSSLVDPAVLTVGDSHPLSPIKRPNRRRFVCRSTLFSPCVPIHAGIETGYALVASTGGPYLVEVTG